MTDSQRFELVERYESGLSLASVGERLGVSSGTILNVLRRAGVPARKIGTNQWREVAAARRQADLANGG